MSDGRQPAPVTHPARPAWRRALWIALAWLPFFLAWALLNVAYFGIPFGTAFWAATLSVGSASLLGIGVWWVSGRLEWPDRLHPRFYASHLGLGLVYSTLWIGLGGSLNALAEGSPVLPAVLESPLVGWRFLTGLWLYGLVAGVSYAVRIRRGLQREREAALAAEALASSARLAVLRSQLNPHFLFNALHSLGYLIDADPAQAHAALERLAEVLRYSLDHAAAEVSLESEWAFTRDYLEIESLRYEDRLRWEVAIADDVAGAAVPPFCLQTLVENAVRHGVAVRRKGARVRIAALAEGDRLVLRVSDDGPGADPEALEASSGRGLRLLRERLAALHPGNAGLRVRTAPGEGFESELRLPLQAHSSPPAAEVAAGAAVGA